MEYISVFIEKNQRYVYEFIRWINMDDYHIKSALACLCNKENMWNNQKFE